MKKQQERVFAYTQAKKITRKELQDISGGGITLHITQGPTAVPSGTNNENWDARMDGYFDG